MIDATYPPSADFAANAHIDAAKYKAQVKGISLL